MTRLLPILALLWLAGCASYPKPDPSLIAYSVARPDTAAAVHADAIYGMDFVVVGESMQPFLYAGDYLVADFTKLFRDLKPGSLPVYDPNWADASIPFVCHMAVEKIGECWSVKGINATSNLETGKTAMCEGDYRATVVGVYTSRKKP